MQGSDPLFSQYKSPNFVRIVTTENCKWDASQITCYVVYNIHQA